MGDQDYSLDLVLRQKYRGPVIGVRHPYLDLEDIRIEEGLRVDLVRKIDLTEACRLVGKYIFNW